MAKRSNYERESERVKVSDEEVVEEEILEEKEASPSEPETVRLVLLKQLNLKYVGAVTGKTYTFSGAGAEADVDKEDAKIMMEKRGGRCCGGGIGISTPYFAEV
jgi:hypothetical protein